jgi:DNA-binding beta-propeller fold protein YncE
MTRTRKRSARRPESTRVRMPGLLVAALTAWTATACAQNDYGNPNMTPTNGLPNPYSAKQVMPLPDGRSWGSTAGVDAAKGHDDVWAIDRCGSNTCVGSHDDPLMHYDASGNLIGHMGADLFAFPHGIYVDAEGNVWVTDPLPPDGRGAGGDVGQQVTKLSPSGEILLQLGTRKVSGSGPNQFSSPSDVVVGRNGDIFVADGHGEGTNERIMKFDRNGNFIKAWGKPGNGPCGAGEFSSLHALAIDSQGRLFIGDRDNNRIQIYDQDGAYLECWYQFGRPSGIFIDADDNLFVTDSESRDGADEGLDLAHPGWQRGIRIGSARDGSVRYFIPDPDPQGGSSTSEGVAAIEGGAVVYGAEVGPRDFVRYERR